MPQSDALQGDRRGFSGIRLLIPIFLAFLSLGGWFFYPVYPVHASATWHTLPYTMGGVTYGTEFFYDTVQYPYTPFIVLCSENFKLLNFNYSGGGGEFNVSCGDVGDHASGRVETYDGSGNFLSATNYTDTYFGYNGGLAPATLIDHTFFHNAESIVWKDTENWEGVNGVGSVTSGAVALSNDYSADFNPPYYSAGFTTFSPANASSTGQIVSFVQSYTNNSTSSPYGVIGIEAWWSSQNFERIFNSTTTISAGASSFSVATSLQNNQDINWRGYMYSTTTGAFFYSDMHYFTVGGDPWPSMIGTTTAGIYALATSTCTFTNWTGCFQNALVWAFYPSQGSLDQLTGLKNEIIRKPPFGYFSLIISAMNTLSSTSTPTFSLATSAPVMNNIFTPLRTGIAFVMWILFGVWCIKTFSHFNI